MADVTGDGGVRSLDAVVGQFSGVAVADQVALGDLAIRTRFARTVMWLFAGANVFVMAGLGLVFWQDCVQLWAGAIKPEDRIIDGKVIMSLLGATTVQLGAVIYTITQAIFPKKNAT